MANQEKLVKIGKEAFCIIDNFFSSRTMKAERGPERSIATTPKSTIDSKQAAIRYGGVLIIQGKIKYQM